MRSGRSIRRLALAASLMLAATGEAVQAAPKATGPVASGDPVRGKSLFVRCVACHSVTPGPNRLGPNLAGVTGRKAAAVAGFRYSSAMQKSQLTWTRETLDRYLAAPAKVVPGTSMAFVGVPDARDRADLIAYLATAKAP